MYWPIGAPRIFAHELPHHPSRASHDGLDHVAATGSSDDVRPLHNHPISSSEDLQGLRTAKQNRDEKAVDFDKTAQRHVQNSGEMSLQDEGPNIQDSEDIIQIRVTRQGYLFATITSSTLTIWQKKPTAALVSVVRSALSLSTYGENLVLHLRPDVSIVVLQTTLGYLITYSVVWDTESRAYQLVFVNGGNRSSRRASTNQGSGYSAKERIPLLEGGGLLHKVNINFRMVIRLDAGINRALALDKELMVVTKQPEAIQCISWNPDRAGSETSTELLSHMQWLNGKTEITDMAYDKPMNLYAWVMASGDAFAIQRFPGPLKDQNGVENLFKGYRFHNPETPDQFAHKAAINSKFSLIAVGCADGAISVYSVRDYNGGIALLRRFLPPTSPLSSGNLTTLVYSPDGYCLFAGYENGWVTWSVYGQPGATSFNCDTTLTSTHDDLWLTGVLDACWIGGGGDMIILVPHSNRFWILEFVRCAGTGFLSHANIAQALMQTSTGFMIYQGHAMPELSAIAADVPLWHHVQAPAHYVFDQWPWRMAVISPNGRYLAVAGQRGLAHYSLGSGRWKTFEDLAMQNGFLVRGGMCWHQHILIAAVETTKSHELRVYSREMPLDNSHILHIAPLSAPAVHLATSGEDSILVYTYENVLDHYIITTSNDNLHLVKVGQIALHGIIRAPPRVRAVSWILPECQLQSGDPSQDVVVASVIFLVDGKLVLLQPSTTESGELKYDMRIIANNVEYYILARDIDAPTRAAVPGHIPYNTSNGFSRDSPSGESLQDSLWLFDGQDIKVWPDVHDLLHVESTESGRDMPAPINIPVDFYPVSALLQKGVLFGVEAELMQRHEINFAQFRIAARTALFLPSVLRYHLSQNDSPAAFHLCHQYQDLPYFAHGLEMLLHNVLDEEAETAAASESGLLPNVLSFLSSFPQYLDIIVQCTRKTELRSWKTLFTYLPSSEELFESSLRNGSLKTAGGYLLVLHNLVGLNSDSPQVIRLLRAAKEDRDWDLCKELARFLVALDASGHTLLEALERVELTVPDSSRLPSNRAQSSIDPNGTCDHIANDVAHEAMDSGTGEHEKDNDTTVGKAGTNVETK